MLYGEKPGGIFESWKAPATSGEDGEDGDTCWKLESNTSIFPLRKSAAKRKLFAVPFMVIVPLASPVKLAPCPELSTTVTASVLGLNIGSQAAMVPSAVANRKAAGTP